MSRVSVLDLELIHDPLTHGGWGAARRGECGVSIVAIYDSATSRPYIYWEHELERAMEHVAQTDLLVTFNGKNFDIPILEALTGRTLETKHLDLLAAIHASAGTRKGYGLGDLADRMLGEAKSGDGKGALDAYAKEDWPHLISYCVKDVMLTKGLYNRIILDGGVKSPSGDFLAVDLGGDHYELI